MFGKKFLKFIEIWQKDFRIEDTINEQKSFDANGLPIPWYTYPAIEYLKQFDYRNKKIFEFGCGQSTFFWQERAQKVISVEDKPAWYAKWQESLSSIRSEILLRSEQDYANSILEKAEKYDVIIIDGICRLACAESSVKALAEGGIIILDDSDRAVTSAEYRQAVRTLKAQGLLQIDFYGFCPMNIYPKTTSIFFSRNFNFTTIEPIQPAGGIGGLWTRSRKKRKELYKIQIDEA